jgi:hypothetical protein
MEEKIQADIVPAFTYELYPARWNAFMPRGIPDAGVVLITADGERFTNFPEQHYANGCAMTVRTGRRYKRVVRILKRLRNHMAGNIYAPAELRSCAENTASFLLESLVYNCEDYLFGHTDIFDDVVAVLSHLSAKLNEREDGTTPLTMPAWVFWREVNGIKLLFGADQTWNVSQAACFVDFARGYLGV